VIRLIQAQVTTAALLGIAYGLWTTRYQAFACLRHHLLLAPYHPHSSTVPTAAGLSPAHCPHTTTPRLYMTRNARWRTGATHA